MHYSRLIWSHTSPTEPVTILSEYDPNGWECRKVEIFADGTLGYASENESAGGSQLARIPCPPDTEVIQEPEFRVSGLSKAEFEAAWEQARQTLREAV
jgi:hypothetical protein